MDEVSVIGIDLAKGVFAICLKASDGRVLHQRRVKRAAFQRYMEAAPRVLVGVEAGPSAHYWARWLQGLGFAVKVMSPRAVRAYRCSAHKSDPLDADAVGEAASRATVRAVPIKSEEAQALQALIRIRDRQVKERTRVLNQLRALLLEFGIVVTGNLMTRYPTIDEAALAALPHGARRMFDELFEEAKALEERIKARDRELACQARVDPVAKQLSTIPGIGPVNATQFSAYIVAPEDFARARSMSAYIGVVPRLIASGKTKQLGPITKHGSRDLRRGLVLGGQSIITAAKRSPQNDDPLFVFARRLIAKGKPRNKVAVALANKLARIICTMLRTGKVYDPHHVSAYARTSAQRAHSA